MGPEAGAKAPPPPKTFRFGGPENYKFGGYWNYHQMMQQFKQYPGLPEELADRPLERRILGTSNDEKGGNCANSKFKTKQRYIPPGSKTRPPSSSGSSTPQRSVYYPPSRN